MNRPDDLSISEASELIDSIKPQTNGNGNGSANGLGQIVSDVIWFGPNATCEDGSTFAPLGSINVPAGVKLIAG